MIDSLGTMLMSTTTTATSERRPAHRAARSRLLGILAVFGFVLGATAHAENVLEDLAYTALPGGKVEVTLKFAEPVAEPQVFSTETPPSVALDFADNSAGVILLRIEKAGARILPLTLSRLPSFLGRTLAEQLLHGAFACLGVVLLLYSLAQWLHLRDPLYLAYALVVICSVTFSLHLFGVGELYLWTDLEWPQRRLAGVTSMLAAAASAVFVAEALGADLHRSLRIGLHAVAEGALVAVADTRVTPAPGYFGSATNLVSAALSRDGNYVAAVATTGRTAPDPANALMVGSYDEKAQCVAQVSEFAEQMGVRRKYREGIDQCLDEMLMNALYDAPVDEHGKPLYADVATKSRVTLRPEHKALVQYACDGTQFAVAVRDAFGGLERATVLRYLHKCLNDERQIDRKAGGAGLGLYLMTSSST